MKKYTFLRLLLIIFSLSFVGHGEAKDSDSQLTFDPKAYIEGSFLLDGKEVKYHFYKEVCYVSKPEAIAEVENPYVYQSMNLYVPESAYGDTKAPIFFCVRNGAYRAWDLSVIPNIVTEATDDLDEMRGRALAEGYIVAIIGTRG
jgi:hypothetical protein